MEYNSQKHFLELLIKLIYLIDDKDSYLKKHSENVRKYALLLGNALKLDKHDMEILEISALFHDVGKIGIPDCLLTKTSSLTKQEYEIMKRHPIIGEQLFSISGFEDVRKIIRSHHERIDGNGYPDGLKGSEIPYLARIISVVDTYDAMTTQRSYNKVKTKEEAIMELKNVSKKKYNCYSEELVQQLDPFIVDVFVNTLKNDINFEENNKIKKYKY